MSYKCPTCKKKLCLENDKLAKKWAYLAAHYHETHGMPEAVIFGSMEKIIGRKIK